MVAMDGGTRPIEVGTGRAAGVPRSSSTPRVRRRPGRLAGPALATRPTPSDLLHGAPDGMIVVDPAGRIVVTNRRMAELFGYTPVELTGMTDEDLLPEELRTARIDRRLSFNETPHAHELGSGLGLLGRRRDGSIFPVDVALNPLATRKGPMVVARSEERRVG